MSLFDVAGRRFTTTSATAKPKGATESASRVHGRLVGDLPDAISHPVDPARATARHEPRTAQIDTISVVDRDALRSGGSFILLGLERLEPDVTCR